MGLSGFFIFVLGGLTVKSSGWYIPPAIPKYWDYFGPPFYYNQPVQTPLELMVDITNALGVAILQDQSFSKANFAFSPYGVTSVLVVLYEGCYGESARQIQRAVKFPLDKNLIRIGFRDMHRHLKSYFSHEGYLSGIALNKDIIVLKQDFKKILNFYGYDVESQGSSEENTGISTEKTSTFSTTTKPFPIATTTQLSTTSSSLIGGIIQQTTTNIFEDITSTLQDITVYTKEVAENQTELIESSTKSSIMKQSESETQVITTEREESHELKQQEFVNSIKSNETLEVKETTTLANTVNDKQSIEDEDGEKITKNNINNMDVTTNANENLNINEITDEKVTITDLTTEGIGAVLDNGMLIPQFGDLETTIKSLEKDMAFVAAEEFSSTSSSINYEITEAQILTSTIKETKDSPDLTKTTTQKMEETENYSEMITSSLNIKTTEESSISELSTLNNIKDTLVFSSETTKTKSSRESETTTMSPQENMSTTIKSDFSQLSENDIYSTLTTSTPTLSSIVNKFTTVADEITEITSEPSGETTATSTSTSGEKIRIKRFEKSSPDSSKKIQKEKDTKIVNLKKNKSVSLNSVGMWRQMDVITKSNTTKNKINQQFHNLRNPGLRIKRTLSDYLRLPSYSDLTIQLQNGMHDNYAFSNLNFYKNLPRQLFLVNCAVDTPVPMIFHINIFLYGYIPKLHSKALEFPLDDIRYKLLILLPIERRGLNQLIYDLSNCSLREVIESLRPSKVRVTIPMFMTEGFVLLTSSLQKLGIRDVFESDKADLSRMSTDPELYVRNIEQSVTVVIRNYVEMLDIQTRTTAARHLIQEFEATHPFVYFVLDTATNVALMAGQILDPLNTRIY